MPTLLTTLHSVVARHNSHIQPNAPVADKAATELELLTMPKVPALSKGFPALTQLQTSLMSATQVLSKLICETFVKLAKLRFVWKLTCD